MLVTGVQTCALPILGRRLASETEPTMVASSGVITLLEASLLRIRPQPLFRGKPQIWISGSDDGDTYDVVFSPEGIVF